MINHLRLLVPRIGVEPTRLAALAPETSASTIPPPGPVVIRFVSLFSLVGVKGFEPSTPCSQSRCANRTALRPEIECKINAFIRHFQISDQKNYFFNIWRFRNTTI